MLASRCWCPVVRRGCGMVHFWQAGRVLRVLRSVNKLCTPQQHPSGST